MTLSSTTTNSIKIDMTYGDYSTRSYTLPMQDMSSEGISAAKAQIRAINTATQDSLSSVHKTFVSEDGYGLERITDAVIITKTEEVLYNVQS